MKSQRLASIPRAVRASGECCLYSAFLLLEASATAESIGVASYDSWQWNGFTRTVR